MFASDRVERQIRLQTAEMTYVVHLDESQRALRFDYTDRRRLNFKLPDVIERQTRKMRQNDLNNIDVGDDRTVFVALNQFTKQFESSPCGQAKSLTVWESNPTGIFLPLTIKVGPLPADGFFWLSFPVTVVGLGELRQHNDLNT